MISFSSIWAIVLRHAHVWKRDFNLSLMGFYWPFLDIIIWGFLGSWIAKSNITSFENYETVALLGVLLWQIVGRGSNTMHIAFVEEIWSNNVVNLFSLPIRIVEWMIGMMIFSTIVLFLTTTFCMLFIPLLYDISMYNIITTYLIFMPPLFLSSIWIGFTRLQTIVLLGKGGIEIGWTIAWFLMPFSGAYYPVDVLPTWAQKISSILPMSYIFQGMRKYVMHQEDPTSYLIKGYILSILYAICAILLFIYCFNRSKQKGLARLTD